MTETAGFSINLCITVVSIKLKNIKVMDGWLCFMSLRQRGHLEMAPPFTKGFEARF